MTLKAKSLIILGIISVLMFVNCYALDCTYLGNSLGYSTAWYLPTYGAGYIYFYDVYYTNDGIVHGIAEVGPARLDSVKSTCSNGNVVMSWNSEQETNTSGLIIGQVSYSQGLAQLSVSSGSYVQIKGKQFQIPPGNYYSGWTLTKENVSNGNVVKWGVYRHK